MSSKSPQRYQIFEVELARPLEDIVVPADAGGIALVLRSNDTPVGFLMEEHPAGSIISSATLAARILEKAGPHILAEKIYAELRGVLEPKIIPTVEIAICTHGRPDALKRCLQSLQDLGQLRVMVIDNAPDDDGTAQVVSLFPYVRYVLEPKPGLDFARNRGLKESSAEILAFLDDDVVVDRCWLQGLQEAWAVNPDAGAFAGPILPFELETKAQVTFERMGGFGKSFDRVRFGADLPDIPTYPVGAGIFGAGANMAFRRDVLLELGGFDEALDTGAPLPGGGDLDIFYRVIRAGYPLIREPKLLVYHQHRREYKKLRHQMWTWGQGTAAFLTKSWRTDPAARPKIRRWALWWLGYQLSKFVPRLRRNRGHWPWDMVTAEITGGFVGAWGEYDRSADRVERLRRRFS